MARHAKRVERQSEARGYRITLVRARVPADLTDGERNTPRGSPDKPATNDRWPKTATTPTVRAQTI